MRRCRSNAGNDASLRQHCQIARYSDGRSTKESRELLARGRSHEPAARELCDCEKGNGNAAADQSALEPQSQEMLLKMPCDEIVLGANEMQHFDHRPVGRDRGAGGEDDGQHSGAKHEQEKADAEHNDRAGYGTHTVDEAAMVVEAHTRYLLSE